MVYHMTIAGLERDLPVCKVSDSLFIGAFVIFGDQELTVAAAGELLKKAPAYDYLITVFDVAVHSITTAKEQHLYLDTADAALMAGKRILIVDDVISTGESLAALEALVKKAGGNIVGRMAILAEGDAQNREDILYLEKLPLFHPDGTVME